MKIYELVIIFNLSKKKNLKNFLSFIKNILILNNNIILNIEIWGIIKFCFKIKHHKRGLFLFIRFISNKIFYIKIVNYLKINDNSILRFFLKSFKTKNNYINYLHFKKILRRNVNKKIFKKKN